MHNTLIAAFEGFISIDEREKELISSLFTEHRFRKGEYFLKEGAVCRQAGFILEGLVRYYNTRESGEEVTMEFGKEGDFVCNYESFLDHSPSARNIQYIEDGLILLLSYEGLQLIYEKVRSGQQFGRLICEQLYVQAIKKIVSLYADPPEERYRFFIEQYPDLVQRVPQYYIASFVGVKPPSLSRIRKRLTG